MTNLEFSMAHVYPLGGVRRYPWLHIEMWAFLYYQHNVELSSVNVDYLGSRRYILYIVKGLKGQS